MCIVGICCTSTYLLKNWFSTLILLYALKSSARSRHGPVVVVTSFICNISRGIIRATKKNKHSSTWQLLGFCTIPAAQVRKHGRNICAIKAWSNYPRSLTIQSLHPLSAKPPPLRSPHLSTRPSSTITPHFTAPPTRVQWTKYTLPLPKQPW